MVERCIQRHCAPVIKPAYDNPETAAALAATFKGLGYKYVTLDLEGYRTGSANEVLSDSETSKFKA